MENLIKEMSLEDTISKLNEQKNIFYANSLDKSGRLIAKIDELIKKAENLSQEENLENTVLLGSTLDIKICYANGEYEYVTYTLGFDFSETTISIFSPLGYSVFLANVQDTVSYTVNDNYIEAIILNKNIIEEKSNIEEIEGPVKEKISN